MDVTTRVDRPGYRWMTWPEPAVVVVEVTAPATVGATSLRVSADASGAIGRIRHLGADPADGDRRATVHVGDLAPGERRTVVLFFSPRTARRPGSHVIGTIQVDWTDESGTHRIGRRLSATVLPAGSPRARQEESVAALLAAHRRTSGPAATTCRSGTAD